MAFGWQRITTLLHSALAGASTRRSAVRPVMCAATRAQRAQGPSMHGVERAKPSRDATRGTAEPSERGVSRHSTARGRPDRVTDRAPRGVLADASLQHDPRPGTYATCSTSIAPCAESFASFRLRLRFHVSAPAPQRARRSPLRGRRSAQSHSNAARRRRGTRPRSAQSTDGAPRPL